MESNYVNSMSMTFAVDSEDFSLAGEASSKIKRILQELGIDAAVIRKAAIAAYEAEMNIVIHAIKGFLQLSIDDKKIVIIAEDEGPGIDNIQMAMQEGYSTAPDHIRELGFGAGMGLPNIKKCSDDLKITAERGVGTKVEMTFFY